jgi:DNA-binding NtrC family response regulator
MAQRPDRHGNRLALYRGPHVLVAHGERLVREGLVGILRRAGYDVDEAGDADEALAVLDKSEVRALVVSVRLPPDGHLALLAACEGSAPIVLINGSDDDVARLTEDRRVQSVLTRPFPLQALYDAVAEATCQPQAQLGVRKSKKIENQPEG